MKRMSIRVRLLPLLFGFLALTLPSLAQDVVGKLETRYRVDFNLERFPQKKPQEAMLSVVKAVGEKRYVYLLAQLTNPVQVDERVLRIAEKFTKGSLEDKKFIAFEDVVRVTADHFLKDPVLLQELRKFASGAEWDEKGELAIGTHKDLPGRKVTFYKIENRWFLDNRQK